MSLFAILSYPLNPNRDALATQALHKSKPRRYLESGRNVGIENRLVSYSLLRDTRRCAFVTESYRLHVAD